MTRKKTKTKPNPPPPFVPALPPPDDPLKREEDREPSPERAKQMAQARVDALKKLGRMKDE